MRRGKVDGRFIFVIDNSNENIYQTILAITTNKIADYGMLSVLYYGYAPLLEKWFPFIRERERESS